MVSPASFRSTVHQLVDDVGAFQTNPFIDPGYQAYVAKRNEAFQSEWARQQQNMSRPRRSGW
jgi:hypothetical protein